MFLQLSWQLYPTTSWQKNIRWQKLLPKRSKFTAMKFPLASSLFCTTIEVITRVSCFHEWNEKNTTLFWLCSCKSCFNSDWHWKLHKEKSTERVKLKIRSLCSLPSQWTSVCEKFHIMTPKRIMRDFGSSNSFHTLINGASCLLLSKILKSWIFCQRHRFLFFYETFCSPQGL